VVDARGLSAAWLSEALDRDVRAVQCERIGTGVTAATYRLTLDSPGLPPTLVAKVAAGDETARQRVATGFRAEVGFYAGLAQTLDVRAPQCWYAGISDDALGFTLLLEDLTPRLPGRQADGCSIEQAEAAVRNLAGLHAPRWNDPRLLDLDFIPKASPARAAFLAGLTRSATEVFVDRYRADLVRADLDTLFTAAEFMEQWLVTRPEPFAVIHGDYRLDNLMFAPSGADVVAVDWQTLAVAPPARDLAYFLGTSLAVPDRRAAEAELVDAYHARISGRGVTGYSVEQCFADYRLGQLQAVLITTLGAAFATAPPNQEADGMFIAMARRSCTAIRDLRSFDLL
jgi:hypothetical protein